MTRDQSFLFLSSVACICFCGFAAVDISTLSSDEVFSRFLKFSSVVACAAIAWTRPGLDRRDTILLRIAFLLTVFADFFLGILHLFIPGVAIFALVHIVYVMRHLRGISSLVAEGILAGFCLVFAIVIMSLSSPAMARAGLLHESIAYAVPLTFSLYAGIGVMIRDHFRIVHRIRIVVGIVLFFAVDIAVAHFQALPDGLMRTILGIAIWPLYLPSQFLLACSGSGAKQGVPVCVSVPRSGPSNPFLRLRLD